MIDAFSTVKIERLLAETFVERVEHHATLSSTNDRARAAADETGSLPLLVVADEQTAGRGRGGHKWWTGPGSLAMSLLFDPAMLAIPREFRLRISLATAVAVVDTLQPLVPGEALGLHWPNDVFAAGRKLGGILIEGLSDGRMIVGIGVNANNSLEEAPPEVQRTAISLLELTGEPQNPTNLVAALLNRLEATLRQLSKSPRALGRRFNQLCLQRGQQLAIRQGNTTSRGRCEGIAEDGALLLSTPKGNRKFYSGTLS